MGASLVRIHSMKKIEYSVDVNDEGGKFFASGDFHQESEAIQWAVEIVDKLKVIRKEQDLQIHAIVKLIADDKHVAAISEHDVRIM